MSELIDKLSDKDVLNLLRACLARLVRNEYSISFNSANIDAYSPEDYAGHFDVYKKEYL